MGLLHGENFLKPFLTDLPVWRTDSFPDGDPCGPQSDASAMYHVRTAPSVIVPSPPPARAHGTSCRSAYATLGYQRPSENVLILRRVLRPRRICDIYDLFASCINLLTYLLTNGHTDGRAIAYTRYLLHNMLSRVINVSLPLQRQSSQGCVLVWRSL